MLPAARNTVYNSGSSISAQTDKDSPTPHNGNTNYTNHPNSKSIIWAKMPGFAHWPARYCTSHEHSILELTKSSKKSEKTNYTSVAFLGNNYQR